MNTDDEQIRALLDEAVSDVEPRRSLDEIRSRTTSSRSRRPWVWGAGGAVLATAATIAAIAALSSGPGTTDAGPGPATGDGTGSGVFDERSTYDVYFVGETSHGLRLFVEPHAFDDGDQAGVLQLAHRRGRRRPRLRRLLAGRVRRSSPSGRTGAPPRHRWSSTCPAPA